MSAIFTTLDAFVDACQAAPGLAGVMVHDGPPVDDAGLEYPARLFIGEAGAEDETAVTGQLSWLDSGAAGQGAQAETFTVSCVAEYLSGDTDMRAARAACKAIYDATVAVVEANHTISGTVFDALIGGQERYVQVQTEDGALASMIFTVDCQAHL